MLIKLLGATLYMVDEAAGEVYQIQKNVQSARHRVNWKIADVQTVAAFVAKNKEYVMVDDILDDTRFPQGVGNQGISFAKCLLHIFSLIYMLYTYMQHSKL